MVLYLIVHTNQDDGCHETVLKELGMKRELVNAVHSTGMNRSVKAPRTCEKRRRVDFDKSTLTKKAQTILKRNIQLLKENPKAQILIAGYSSAAGTEAINKS